MINLTLNKLKRPALQNLVPKFGTKVEKNDINKGGLSTAEVDLNMTLPFELMREIEVSSSDTTTKIQYDAKIAIVGSDPVTLTLDQATYKGCTITIKNRNTEQATIVLSEDLQKNLESKKSIILEWDGTAWNDITLIIDSTVSEDSHNPISSAAVYQKATEITQTVTNETNARNEAIAEERQLREEAYTAVEQQINEEVEDRKNSDNYFLNRIKSTDNNIGQLESLKTTDKSNTVAAINEVFDSVQQGGGNSATNCEQFTFVVDSNEKLAEWANDNRSKGQDYTSVLIRKGTWTSTISVNLTNAETKVVVGEAGSKLVFNNVINGLFYNALPIGSEFYMIGVNISATARTTSYGFYMCNNLTNCTGTGTGKGYGNGFRECNNLTNCTGTGIGTGTGTSGYGNGFYICNNLTNCTGTGTGTGKGKGNGFSSCRCVSCCKAGKNCTTSAFSNSFASNAQTDTYACADTANGGFNNTTNPT